MAKKTIINDLVFYGAVAGVSWLGYRMALGGHLGNDLQLAAKEIQSALHVGSGYALGQPDTSDGTGSTGDDTGVTYWRTSDNVSGTGDGPGCMSKGNFVRTYPQPNGDGSFSAVGQMISGYWYVTFSGANAKAAMENWYNRCWGTFVG